MKKVHFVKDNHGFIFDVKNRKHYLKLKFRFEQQGYIETELPDEDEETIGFA